MSIWLEIALIVGVIVTYAFMGGIVFAVLRRLRYEIFNDIEVLLAALWLPMIPVVICALIARQGARLAGRVGDRIGHWLVARKIPQATARKRG